MARTSKYNHREILKELQDRFGEDAEVTRSDLADVYEDPAAVAWIFRDKKRLVKRGVYSLSSSPAKSKAKSKKQVSALPEDALTMSRVSDSEDAAETLVERLVPTANNLYVPWGHHNTLKKIIKSDLFLPVFITGLSGCGKTYMVEQVCAQLEREFFKVSISKETCEDDLIGGFRLVKDKTVWFDGPVIRAMKRGAVLLLDEIDYGQGALACLQAVLEGKGVLIKKINKFVTPAPGFTVVATANTKGQGDDTGKFAFTNIMNEAFLDRFPVTFEQSYAPESTETQILEALIDTLPSIDQNEKPGLIKQLLAFAHQTRATFEAEGCDEIISTRRLCKIVELYSVLGNKKKSVELCINRFDADTKASFLEAFRLYDPEEIEKQEQAKREAEEAEKARRQDMDGDLSSILGG